MQRASFPFHSLAVVAALPCSACASFRSHESPRLDRAALDRRVESLMVQAYVPGLALAVIRNGEVAYVKAYGERDTGRHLPLQADTVMYAASVTKAAFAYGVMMMAEDGRMNSIARSTGCSRSRCPSTKSTPTSPATSAGAH